MGPNIRCTCRRFLFFLAILALGACDGGREIAAGLNARESLDVVVALRRAHIGAERIKRSSGAVDRFSIEVPEREQKRAEELMHEFGLPRTQDRDIDALTRPQGLAPLTPEQADLRLDHALSLQLEQLLEALPGVVNAQVVVRAHLSGVRKPAAGTPPQRPSASAVIRYSSPSGNLPFSPADVKTIAAQTVPGLNPEDVLVSTSRITMPGENDMLGVSAAQPGAVQPESVQLKRLLWGFRVPEEDKRKAVLWILLYLILFCAAGGILGYVGGNAAARKRMKNARKTPKEMKMKNLVLESGADQNTDDTGKYLRREALKGRRSPEQPS